MASAVAKVDVYVICFIGVQGFNAGENATIVLQAVSSFNGQRPRQNMFKGFSLTTLRKPIGICLCSRLGYVSEAGWHACEFE